MSYLELFSWKYYFGHTTFLHLFTHVNGHHQSFSQSQQKLTKKITRFTIQFLSKHLIHFMNLNSLDIENNMLPRHSQDPFWIYKFFSKCFFVWCQRKHLHCTISCRPRTTFLKHFESKCLFVSGYLREKMFVRET